MIATTPDAACRDYIHFGQPCIHMFAAMYSRGEYQWQRLSVLTRDSPLFTIDERFVRGMLDVHKILIFISQSGSVKTLLSQNQIQMYLKFREMSNCLKLSFFSSLVSL